MGRGARPAERINADLGKTRLDQELVYRIPLMSDLGKEVSAACNFASTIAGHEVMPSGIYR